MKKILFIVISLIILQATNFYAQEDIDKDQLDELRDMDLNEMLKSEVTVTTHVPLSMREAPGIVTLITREEIINTGARDLVDALTLLVPGFHFNQSQYGPLAISVRGMWAFEGKVLLLIDGVECNDEAFSGAVFGNHYLVENIDRIEIIRGPGSIIYGGHAALGVINIFTRNKEDFQGAYAGIQYGRMSSNFSQRNFSFGLLKKLYGVDLSLTGYIGEGRIGNNKFSGVNTTSTADSGTGENEHSNIGITSRFSAEKLNPFNLNVSAAYGEFEFRGIFENYKTLYDIPINFNSFNSQFKYTHKFSDDYQIQFKYTNKYQKPWSMLGKVPLLQDTLFKDTLMSNNKIVTRNSAELSAIWNITDGWILNSGMQYQHVNAKIAEEISGYYEIPFGNGKTSAKKSNFSFYSEIMYLSDAFNFTIGGRMEASSGVKPFFIPRIAITKIFDPFHIKLMYCKAYRIPSGVYLDLSLEPEQSQNYEAEIGYQISRSDFFTLDLYRVTFTDIITFSSDRASGTYDNKDQTGTEGIEAEYRVTKSGYNIGINCAYYRALDNSVKSLHVPGHDKAFLGHPNFKANLYAGIKLSNNISVNPSFTLYGTRYGYVLSEIQPQPGNHFRMMNEIKEYSPTLICDMNFRSDDLFVEGMQLDLTVKNIFNSQFEYLQATEYYEPPLPANSTTLVLRLLYEFNL